MANELRGVNNSKLIPCLDVHFFSQCKTRFTLKFPLPPKDGGGLLFIYDLKSIQMDRIHKRHLKAQHNHKHPEL